MHPQTLFPEILPGYGWIDTVFSVAVILFPICVIAAFVALGAFFEWLDYTPAKQREREQRMLEREIIAYHQHRKAVRS